MVPRGPAGRLGGPKGQGKSPGGPIRATGRLDGSDNDLGSTTGDDLGGPKVAKGGKR